MSITVRLWSDEDLQSLRKDKWLATIFMNCKTFSEREIKYYPYATRRAYICNWEEEELEIYATDERMLLRFIDAEYTIRPVLIHQKIIQFRPVKVS